MTVIDELFEQTKKGIKEILESDVLKKVRNFVYGEVTYKFEHDDIMKMLPKIQAINMGVIDEVIVHDVNGDIHTLPAKEYIERNHAGFMNKMQNELDLESLLGVLNSIQTFTALANFGSFDMAKKFYLEDKEEEVVEEETGEEIIEE